jgi:mannose-6-phosphate isomerase-like protein (cupin superfamily)
VHPDIVDTVQTPFRRIVTGHDDEGKAIIASDGPPPRTVQIGGDAGATFYEVWNTRETPALIDRRSGEPEESGLILAPPKGGTRIRVIDFPPEGDDVRQLSEDEARARFSEIGGADASTAGGPHPLMHRTETVDYGIVLDGELTLIVDDDETTVRAGDIVIQRGTNHAWANRSGAHCRIAFILIDGEFTDGL